MPILALSPLNFSDLIARQQEIAALPSRQAARGRLTQITVYRCPSCSDLHEDEDAALDCCGLWAENALLAIACPVCADKAPDHYAAAECCLWKDMDLPTRWKVATAVRRGATWAEALGMDPGITGHWAKAGLGVRRLS